MKQNKTDQSIKDLTIIIADAEAPDGPGSVHAFTKVFRYDLVGDVEEFIKALEELKNSKGYDFIIEGGRMGNLD